MNTVSDIFDKGICELMANFLIILCVVTVIFLNANISYLPLVIRVVILKMNIYFFYCDYVKTIWRHLSLVLHFYIQWNMFSSDSILNGMHKHNFLIQFGLS